VLFHFKVSTKVLHFFSAFSDELVRDFVTQVGNQGPPSAEKARYGSTTMPSQTWDFTVSCLHGAIGGFTISNWSKTSPRPEFFFIVWILGPRFALWNLTSSWQSIVKGDDYGKYGVTKSNLKQAENQLKSCLKKARLEDREFKDV
jgi:hypothetical protein